MSFWLEIFGLRSCLLSGSFCTFSVVYVVYVVHPQSSFVSIF
uniref:Uncharacterized protein n=1 Tax=Rhizophora mucronata TaxID=61149 RepID=A0A2P2QQB1_RHIMU